VNDLFSVLQATGGVGGWALAIALVGTFIKVWPKLKELQIGSDGSLRHDLLQEIARLRADIVTARAEAAAERVVCDAKMAAMELKHSAEIQGLKSQMQQILESIGRSSNAPTTIGQTIARAYPLPIDMQDNINKLDGDGA
jgi:hypothetical protein